MKIFKKIAKIIGIIVLLLIIALVSVPFLFKDTIKEKVLTMVNENLNAKVSFDDISINLFKNFPNANVSLENLSVVNIAPFEGDTLVYANQLGVKVNLKDIIFKGENDPYSLLGFSIENALVNVSINSEGKGSFDIVKPTNVEEETQETTPISLNIKEYAVKNLEVRFKDEASKMSVVLDSLYHSGKGDFANEVLDLDTHTKTKLSFVLDQNQFTNQLPLTLDAILGIDLKNQKYSFKENKLLINQMALEFDGFVQLLENGQKYNMSFKTPTTSFENFLALIPKAYSKSLDGVKTSGNFTINGKIDGDLTETTIPKIDIELLSKNAYFKYPDLPKAVNNINIDVKIGNTTQKLDDTFVDVRQFAFAIDKDHFASKAMLTNLVKNPNVDANINGTINLGNLKQAYPMPMDLDLQGILKANIQVAFDMASIEKQRYENVKSSGSGSLENFIYSGAGFIKPFHIEKAALNFNTAKIQLTEFLAKTGKTDLSIKGMIDNLYGFLFRKEILKGDFILNSNLIAVDDFMQKEVASEEKPTENQPQQTKKESTEKASIKVPAFLDCTFQANAKSILYDNLDLKNVAGKLIVKDEKVTLQNLSTEIFGGKIAIMGDISTKGAKPTFNTKLDISKLNILESFTQLEMLKKIAPIANVLQGLFNSDISISGVLNEDMTPDINSLKGNLGGSLQDAKIKETGSNIIKALNTHFPKLNIAGAKLNDIKANLTFENGKVNIQPFNINLGGGSSVKVSGTHGFDQSMNYNLVLDIPPTMLGKDAEQILSKLTASEQQKLKNIPVNVGITGSFDKPSVNADLKNVLTNLAQQAVQGQANKLIDKGIDKGLDVLGKALGGNKQETTDGNTSPQATEKKEEVKKAVGNIIGGFLNRKKDTTSKK